jgi:FkbM family methyltransferase
MANIPQWKRVLARCIPNVKLSTRVPFGGKVHFFARVHKGLLIRNVMDFPHEACIFRLYATSLDVDAIVYDVGANIGLHTVALALRLPRGRVVAFEPDPDNLALLGENIALNNVAERVLVVPKAVSDVTGETRFWRDTLSSATGTIAPRNGNSWYHEATGAPPDVVPVQATTLDDFVAAHPELVPHLIKIDVEGAETQAVEGMRALAKAHGPAVVVDGTPVACARLLSEWGYCLRDLLTGKEIEDIGTELTFTVLAEKTK